MQTAKSVLAPVILHEGRLGHWTEDEVFIPLPPGSQLSPTVLVKDGKGYILANGQYVRIPHDFNRLDSWP